MSEETIEKTEQISKEYSEPASDQALIRTMAALKENGIQSFSFDSEIALKNKLFQFLPKEAEVMTMTSVTLDQLEITDEIINSGRYNPVRNQLTSLGAKAQRKLVSSADYSIGSVHAVTEKGEVMIASATGSQLPAYAYGSENVIWVVGTQKLVKNIEEGHKRIREYCLPLEDKRARKVYNVGSRIGKVLTVNSEKEGRIIILFLKQNIGF